MGSSAETVKLHNTPAKETKVLHVDETGSLHKQSWNYRAIIGCLNYLQAMTQPDLSYSVHLNVIGMGSSADTVKLHNTPAKATRVLHVDKTGSLRKQSWNYQAIIGCLNYLQAMTRPDLSYSFHQCAHICNAPKLSHKQAIKCICHYLRGTRNKGLFFLPDLHLALHAM